jgi:hypothetical protein
MLLMRNMLPLWMVRKKAGSVTLDNLVKISELDASHERAPFVSRKLAGWTTGVFGVTHNHFFTFTGNHYALTAVTGSRNNPSEIS